MPRLLNIAKADEKPLIIDAAEVTGILVYQEKEELSLCNSRGELIRINYKDWNVDVNEALAKLEESGNPLIRFPIRDEDGKDKEQLHYIAPAAVSFITVSKPGKDGNVGVIAGVKGVGQERTWSGGMTQAECDGICAAVRAVKPLLAYAPEEAYSRWIPSSALYIDPKLVTEISDQESQLTVSFARSGSLDVQIKKTPIERFLPPDYVEGDQSESNNQKFNQAFVDMMSYDSSIWKERQQARFDFAAAIVAANDELISISSDDRVGCIRKENVGYISLQGNSQTGSFYLNINSQGSPSNPYGGGLTVAFKTAAERQKVLDVLDKALSAPPRKPTPPAQGKLKP